MKQAILILLVVTTNPFYNYYHKSNWDYCAHWGKQQFHTIDPRAARLGVIPNFYCYLVDTYEQDESYLIYKSMLEQSVFPILKNHVINK